MDSFEAALRSDRSNAQIARDFGKSKDAVRRARKRLGLSSPFSASAPQRTEAAGESETHNADGTSSYVRFSAEPWGYEDYREFIRSTGQDPDQVTFTWGWTSNPGGGFWNKLNNVRPVAGTTDATVPLTELYKRVEAFEPRPLTSPVDGDRALVVALADWQLGKTARRGGTPETLARLAATREQLDSLYRIGGYRRIILFDLGDGIEGFESGGNPMFTNDLSLPDQLDCYATELFEFIADACQYAPVTLASVPSNHSAWRRGKQNLGRPSDDFGLYVNKQVEKAAQYAKLNAVFIRPEEYDESVSIDVLGTQIGGVHGNQFAPGKAIDWWQGQAFGSQAVTKSDVLLTGHYHSFGAGVAGINPNSGRERMWLGAPTVDPGSDWYRNIKGRDSLPGTLIFTVDELGFDLGSLQII